MRTKNCTLHCLLHRDEEYVEDFRTKKEKKNANESKQPDMTKCDKKKERKKTTCISVTIIELMAKQQFWRLIVSHAAALSR